VSAADSIRVDTDGPVLWITIDRPTVLNALDPASHRRLSAAFDRYAAEDGLRVAVITGAGDRAFCVGSDLKVRAEIGGDDMPPTGFGGIAQRFDLTKPVVAAVNGHAIGGGLEIVLACDLAIAVSTAKFGLPEAKVGLAAASGLHRLARQLPEKWAMRIALTGELFSAEAALGFGLINEVAAPDVYQDAVRRLVDQLLAAAPMSQRATKQMMRAGLDQPSLAAAFAGRYPEYDAMLASEDAREGSRAFLEKRPPVWRNR
jgi:crotonobetainyl-CoA hydratase